MLTHSELNAKKYKIYIETSVVSYFVSRPSRDIVIAGHQVATQALWDMLTEFAVYSADVVLHEASGGDQSPAQARLQALAGFSVLEMDDEAKKLAQKFILHSAVPENSLEDALHIAIAAVNGINAIVTWNFNHINNPFTKTMIREIIENNGYVYPEICSPDELMGDKP